MSHGQGRYLFLDDGRIEIDTNVVERSIRPTALWRATIRMRRFAGSDERGANCAIISHRDL